MLKGKACPPRRWSSLCERAWLDEPPLCLPPPTPAPAEVLRRERAYFADNAPRMDYPRYVAAQLPIGSGAVESLCKTLIEAREKGAGMR